MHTTLNVSGGRTHLRAFLMGTKAALVTGKAVVATLSRPFYSLMGSLPYSWLRPECLAAQGMRKRLYALTPVTTIIWSRWEVGFTRWGLTSWHLAPAILGPGFP
jgi:hypothetical protein